MKLRHLRYVLPVLAFYIFENRCWFSQNPDMWKRKKRGGRHK